MRTRLAICVLAVLACFTGPLNSETQPAAPNPIDQLSWLMGGKWTAEGEKGPDGKPFYVEARFRQADNHQGLEFTTWFLTDGKLVPVYSGLYAWHPAKKKFTFLYTDDKGVLTEGEAAWSGNHLEQEFQIIGVDAVAHTYRSTIVRTGDDDYDWNVRHQDKSGAWVVIFGLKYKRKPL